MPVRSHVADVALPYQVQAEYGRLKGESHA